jgi:ATP-dependent Lon protease
MATAIASAALRRPVRHDVAMTGEITLSGLVLPIGGIREKVMAARRHGIHHVILPQLNEPDLRELPEEVRRDMRFTTARTLEEVFAVAFADAARPLIDIAEQEQPAAAGERLSARSES